MIGINFLFKNLRKNHDRATKELIGDSGNQQIKEIKSFPKARFVITSQHQWQLSRYEIVDKSQPVVQLDEQLEVHHVLVLLRARRSASRATESKYEDDRFL